MERQNIERVLIYTLIVILAAVLIAGAVLLVAKYTNNENKIDDEGDPPSTTASSETKGESEPPVTGDETAGAADETSDVTDTTETQPPETDPPAGTTDAVTVSKYGTTKIMYATSNVNARASYSTTSIIIGMFYKGDEVTVKGETDNGWYLVDFRGHDAYIRSDLLTDDAEATTVSVTAYTSPKTMYATSNVNVRESYTTNSTSFALISVGTEVTVTGETDNGWYQVSYDGKTAYIKSEYLSNTKPAVETEAESEA